MLASAPHLLLLTLLAGAAEPPAATVETEVTVESGDPAAADEGAPAEGPREAEAPADGEAVPEAAESEFANLPVVAPTLKKRKLPQPEYGPFYEDEPVSDTVHSSDPPRTKPPLLSVGNGAFCFVEDARCSASLLASADVGVGVNVPAGDRGVDVPLTQYAFRGGFTLRPVTLARRRWHRWAVGVVAGFARTSGALASTASTSGEAMPDFQEVIGTNATRFALVNQLWLSQKRHALHLDLSIGVVRSQVLTSSDRFLGTHADLALGVGGWGALFVAGDFLDQDTRLLFGFRGHAIAAGPIAALVILGLLAAGGGL